jgi:hypothetical protein
MRRHGSKVSDMDQTDGSRVKTMLNVTSPASGPPRVVGPPELVIAENDALRTALDAALALVAEVEAENEQLRAGVAQARYLLNARALDAVPATGSRCPNQGIGDHDCVEHGDTWPPGRGHRTDPGDQVTDTYDAKARTRAMARDYRTMGLTVKADALDRILADLSAAHDEIERLREACDAAWQQGVHAGQESAWTP